MSKTFSLKNFRSNNASPFNMRIREIKLGRKFKHPRNYSEKRENKDKVKAPKYVVDSINQSFQMKILSKLQKLKKSNDKNLLPPKVPKFSYN
mmetsp:Transcript_9438/g.8319  ORF Transcript_9438/g.8319 Transcript_9438/m.8319 type:complete len:92 (-) Transcript_9438:39-314(-)